MSIELNIFTNYTPVSASGELIKNTYTSFVEIFEDVKTTIWCHVDPKNLAHKDYLNTLSSIFPTVYVTRSLSDGYVKAVTTSTSDYMFMLEHDWIFLTGINHSLSDITEQMQHDNILHLRFNKLTTATNRWDSTLDEKQGRHFMYCITPALSNNPHIIDRKQYIEKAIPHVVVRKGAKGIEEKLTFRSDLTGAIYGPLNYPKTIEHTDGRNAYANREKLN
jgi:hypothetical protein